MNRPNLQTRKEFRTFIEGIIKKNEKKRVKILLVEDTKWALERMKKNFDRYGDVTIATTLEEAKKKINEEDFDFVITDMLSYEGCNSPFPLFIREKSLFSFLLMLPCVFIRA